MKGECITPMYNTQLALSQTRKGKCQGDAPFPTVNQYPGPVKRGKTHRETTNYSPHFRTRDPSCASRDKLSVRSKEEGA